MLMLLLLMLNYSDASFAADCGKHAEGEGSWQKQRQDKGGKDGFQNRLMLMLKKALKPD